MTMELCYMGKNLWTLDHHTHTHELFEHPIPYFVPPLWL